MGADIGFTGAPISVKPVSLLVPHSSGGWYPGLLVAEVVEVQEAVKLTHCVNDDCVGGGVRGLAVHVHVIDPWRWSGMSACVRVCCHMYVCYFAVCAAADCRVHLTV